MLQALTGEAEGSRYALQIGSFCTLVAVQSTALLLFKICQVGGTYTFSPASNVALTEMCKLGLASSLHISHVNRSRSEGSPSKGYLDGLSVRICLHYFGLAILYTVNNQLTFLCFELADPGSYALGKSVAPYLCAVMLRLSGDKLNALQWACIILQCSGIAVTQYDPCKHAGYLPSKAYALIATSTAITAVSSVWNQKVVKGFDVPVNLQNSVLYVFGSMIAILSYVSGAMGPAHGPSGGVGFFEGYTWLAVSLVIWQARSHRTAALGLQHHVSSLQPCITPCPCPCPCPCSRRWCIQPMTPCVPGLPRARRDARVQVRRRHRQELRKLFGEGITLLVPPLRRTTPLTIRFTCVVPATTLLVCTSTPRPNPSSPPHQVMAILVVISVYFFNLNASLNSWLGVLSVLVTTWVYMNIAIKMPKEVVPSEEKSGLLK